MDSNKANNLSGQVRDASGRIVADEQVAIALRYKGNQASATYTVGSGDITLKHGAAAAEVVDPTVGASGVVADGTYATLGAMVDAINLSPNWEAWIVDGLRATVSTAILKTISETTISPTRTKVIGLLVDTSAALTLTRRISAKRLNANRDQNAKRSVVERVKANVNIGSGTLTLTVKEVTPAGVAVRTLLTKAGTDNTELDTGEDARHYQSDFGNDLLVEYTGSVDLPGSGAYLDVDAHIEE